MAYTIEEHRHRFGLWAAARSAQRGLNGGTIEVLCSAIEKSGLLEIVQGHQTEWPSDAITFDAAHRRWCNAICEEFRQRIGALLLYGRAAKLVAIYLKSTVINAGFEESAFAKVIHPPIDRILLQNLAKDVRFAASHRKLWRSVSWTMLDEDRYFELIDSMRSAGLDEDAFWKAERYWSAQE